jgi:hypothetical protein
MKKNLLVLCLVILSFQTFAQVKTEKITAIGQATINLSEVSKNFARQTEVFSIPDMSNSTPKIIPLPRKYPDSQSVEVYKGPSYAAKTLNTVSSVTSPAPSFNFTGFVDNISSIPPDVHGAVGPNHVVTTLNARVIIHNKTTGAVISSVSLDNFWSGLNSGSFTADAFDPKIYYDPFSNRWVFVACGNSRSPESSLLLGVSANTDPTGVWNLYRFDVDATDVNWFDYPSCGYNKNWFVVTGNIFPTVSGPFVGVKIFVFDKTDLYNAGALSVTTFDDEDGFTIVPAETFDNSLNTLYMMEEYSGDGYWRMTQITGTGPSPTYSVLGGISIGAANEYSYTSGAANSSSLPQLGSVNKISSNDARIQNMVYRNGFLWATQTVFKGNTVPKPAAVQWLKFNTSPSLSLNQFGRVDDPTNAVQFAYPSISVNANDDVLLGFSKFSDSQYASAAYAYRKSSDAAGTMQDPYQYKTGEASYFKTYGGTRNRWGDYSVTAIDPSNDLDFWTQQEFASTPTTGGTVYDRWATQWAKVCGTPDQPDAFTVSSATVCSGQNAVLYTASAVSGATSYTWQFSGTGATFSSTTNSVSISFSPSATSGTLSVTANNSCGQSTALTLAISVSEIPATPGAFTTSTTPVCKGQNAVAYAVPSVSGATSYTWGYSGSGATISGTTNSVSVSFSASATSGSLSVVANNATCSSTPQTLAITVNDVPAVPVISTNKIKICSGLGAILTATGCSGTVIWSNGASGNTITVTPTENAIYNAYCSAIPCANSGPSNSISITVIPQSLAVSSATPAPFEATEHITTTGSVTISGNKTYKAGKSILLSPSPTTTIGTSPGAVFEAKIEGCNY